MAFHEQKKWHAMSSSTEYGQSNFQLPSKKRIIIPIVAPTTEYHNQTRVSKNQRAKETDEPWSFSPSLQAHDSDPFRFNENKLNDSIDEPLASEATSQFIITDHVQDVPRNGNSTSALDVYSRNYIPLWLQAVNDSRANIIPCVPFPTIDIAAYLATLAGPQFVQHIESVTLPQLVEIQFIEQVLTPHNYVHFWQNQLQNEFTAQNFRLKTMTLYDQQLQPVIGRQGMFTLHVPGLRENAPRIDLGDIIHVRPLSPLRHGIEAQVHHWLYHGKSHGHLCPGFTGLLYNPQVWELDRAKEKITLKMGDFDSSLRCNIVILLQESKLEPICRAVQNVTENMLWLRKFLFPEVNDGVLQTTLSQASFDIPWIDDLNWEQKKAVHSICTANYGDIPYLISGPPGTGKTKTLVETALQLLRRPGHILICAPSDAAADTLALRLSRHLKPTELFRLNGWTRTFAEVPDTLMHYTYSHDISFSLPPVEQMLSFRIVVTTCRDADLLNRTRLNNVSLSSLLNNVNRLLAPGSSRISLHWTALLLDEAAQATEPDALIPLSVVMPPDNNQYPQLVAAGDQFQLGPNLAAKSHLQISLFQRLFDRETYANHPLSRKHGVRSLTSKMLPIMRPAFANLVRNYRSHPAILSVPSSLFYNDSLIPERKASEEILSWPEWPSRDRWPVLFQQNSTEDAYEQILAGDGTGTGALYNPGESGIAVHIASSLLRHASQTSGSLRQDQIMVMSPFRAQVTQLRKSFRKNKLFEVNIGPLEAFQGLESRIVIICTTRTRLGMNHQPKDHHVSVDKSRTLGVIDEPKRLNVAMTRAQEGLIVIGNAHCLTSTNDKSWLSFLDFCKRNDCFNAPENFVWPDLGGPHHQGRLERALLYAAIGKAEAEQNSTPSYSKEQHTTEAASRLRLKGSQRDMDQEMWQFKELVQVHDCEDVDLILESSPINEAVSNHHDAGNNEDVDQEIDSNYDRNLGQEFYRECVTQ